MDEFALERYFDDSIANETDFLLDDSLESPSQTDQEPQKKSSKEAEDLDLSFLPDELPAQDEASQNQSVDQNVSQDSGIFTQSSAGAAESWHGAPNSAPTWTSTNSGPVPSTAAPGSSAFCPMTPMTPMTPVTERSGIIPQLQNIVSTVNLGCPLNLKFIALQARNAEYNPKRFAAVIMRIREPRTTALIFSSGKMVCTGAKSEEQSRLASRKYARVVQKLGFPARFMDFKIQNMVASCDVFFPIRLEGLVLTHQQFSSYEPELFPGLIYRMVKPRIVLLIFVSGKVVLTAGLLPPPEPECPASSPDPASTARPRQPQQRPLRAPPAAVMVESVDDVEGLSVAVERCPLCSTSRRRLTCARCIQAGDFIHLDGRNPERFSEKSERLKKLRDESQQLQQRVLQALDQKLQADKVKWKIMSCKIKIGQLKEAVARGNEEIKSDRELLLRAQEEGGRLQRRATRHQQKQEKIERHNRKLGEIMGKRRNELQERLDTLAALRREHIAELTRHIFPIQEEKQGSRDPADVVEECDPALTSSTVSELAEARRTTYLSGRWIWDDQNGETSISITGPPVTLPSNGDCSAYYSWVEEKSSSQGPELDHINPAHTISAALCYATQLLTILSHILDVNLPKKLCNSEFCGENLSRYRFTRALSKLNTNILHLCFSQHVDSEKLHPHHTLRNIMFLIFPDNVNLGRTGPFEVSADLEESMEFVEPEADGPAEESGDETVTDEETDLGMDWETVPSPRFCDIPSQSMDLSQSAMQVSQPAANTGGMISSAAASVTSWFRAYTGQR